MALTFLSYCVTLIVARSLVFFAEMVRGYGPSVTPFGIHVHHFVFGMLLLFSALIIRNRSFGSRSGLKAVIVGVGLGLVFDETSLWFPPGPNGYWALQNLLIPVCLAVILGIRAFAYTPKPRSGRPVPVRLPEPVLHTNPERPYISVVIPAFNEGLSLARTLQSFEEQTYRDFELIVVDNNSTDDTSAIAARYGARVLTETSQGVAHARQSGFAAARGVIVATTDADTVVPPGWLARIAHEFKKDEGLAAFGGLYTLSSGPLTARLAIAYLSLPAWRMDRFFCRGWSLPGANLAVRNSMFQIIGGFNTNLKLCEDVDLSHRLNKIGKVTLDPSFLVSTSGRRFRNGLLRGMATYGPNAFARMFFHKHKFDHLPTIRGDNALGRKLSFAPALAGLIFLFTMFYVSNPSVASAPPIHAFMEAGSTLAGHAAGVARDVRQGLGLGNNQAAGGPNAGS